MSDLLTAEDVQRLTSIVGSESVGGRTGGEYVQRLARTALAWRAERDEAHTQNERAVKAIGSALVALSDVVSLDADDDTIVDAANKAAAEHRQMRADHLDAVRRAKAAEEARDLAIVECDEAYRQRDEAKALINAFPVEAKDLRAELAEARRERDEARSRLGEVVEQRTESRKGVANYERQINDARAILGARPEELLSDAAGRHARTEALVTEARKHLEPLVADPSGDIEDLAMMVAHRFSFLLSPTDTRDLRQILRARDGESLKDAARRVVANERAEAEPPQVFRIIPRVTIGRDGVCFEVVTRDPGIRALTADQIARLGLVVCDE